MRVDALDAIETFEMLGQAVKDAGTGKYSGFQLVEAVRERGYRLVLERLPPIDPDNLAEIRRLASVEGPLIDITKDRSAAAA